MDTDSDYAGCVLTRKSSTCAHLFHGVNLLTSGSWTQGTCSLSVAESEFCAGVKGESMLLHAKSMMIGSDEDVGQRFLGTDKSIMERRGAGRMRRLHCPVLWVARTCGFWRDSQRETKGRAQHGRHRHEGGDCSSTSHTTENVEDGMARWSPSAGVECGASAGTA